MKIRDSLVEGSAEPGSSAEPGRARGAVRSWGEHGGSAERRDNMQFLQIPFQINMI